MAMDCGLGRREFFGTLFAAGAAGVTAPCASAADKGPAEAAKPASPLIASAPVLMNPAERSIDVAFAISGADASGWVDISMSPDMSKSVRVYSGDGPVMKVNRLFATIRIRGLRPCTRYYYRIGADRIRLVDEYKPRNLGSETGSKVYSFTTLGPTADAEGEKSASSAFCVIQDTHANGEALDLVLSKIAELKPAAIIWNGDARNFYRTAADAINVFLKPHSGHPEYASETPVMFLNGNHDYRGRFALHLEDLVMFRDAFERAPRYASLGRNFVQRIGDVAVIGLDTGEDKLDTNPVSGGITRMKQYRELQTRWLAEAIESDAVKGAKFKVAFCHIPLVEPDPRENPGDLAPDDWVPGGGYKHPWAAWQRTCANLWGPLFEKAGVCLVSTGHQHRYRLDPPGGGRTWTHLVAGQFDVVEGRVEGGRLVVRVHDARGKRIRKTTTFACCVTP